MPLCRGNAPVKSQDPAGNALGQLRNRYLKTYTCISCIRATIAAVEHSCIAPRHTDLAMLDGLICQRCLAGPIFAQIYQQLHRLISTALDDVVTV